MIHYITKTKLIAVVLAAMVASAIPALVTQAGQEPRDLSAAQAPQITVRLRITAYSSTSDQTDDTPFITASGSFVRDGIVATNLLPFGTKVTIPELFGDKVFVVEDRMNNRYQKTIDIWMASTSKALRFGVHHADVVIVGQPDEVVLR